jgi:hypothetical protein
MGQVRGPGSTGIDMQVLAVVLTSSLALLTPTGPMISDRAPSTTATLLSGSASSVERVWSAVVASTTWANDSVVTGENVGRDSNPESGSRRRVYPMNRSAGSSSVSACGPSAGGCPVFTALFRSARVGGECAAICGRSGLRLPLGLVDSHIADGVAAAGAT